MATTILEAFSQFRSRLEITDLQSTAVSQSQKAVRDVLNQGLAVSDDFLTGSYMRSTMIAPLKEADIDIFVVLDNQYYHDNAQMPGRLLEHVRQVLRRTYTQTPDISRNGQAVTVRFTNFAVDVVPGFNRQGGGFLIPNATTSSWISTDPRRHVQIFAQANASHEGKLVPLIKMIKSWNKAVGSFFTSFHIEVLALQSFDRVTISDYPSGIRYFFGRAADLVGVQQDPAGYGDNVGKYLNSPPKLQEARSRLSEAYKQALRAEQWAQHGLYVRTSIDEWRQLFPLHFPTYG